MSMDKRKGNRRRRKGTCSVMHCLLSLIWPTKQLPIKSSTMNDGEEGIDNSIGIKWAEIEDDVLGMILQLSSPIDCLRAQNVCLSWHSTISKLINCENGLPSPEIPLALFNTPIMNHFWFFNLSTQSVFNYAADFSSENSDQSQISCVSTVQGWMIMVEPGRRLIFFFNPVTNTKVYMRSTLRDAHKIHKIMASTKPTDPKCVVVFLFLDTDSVAFSSISDESWTWIMGERSVGIHFRDAEIFGGKLYALTHESSDSLLVCDLTSKPVKPQVLAKLPAPRIELVNPELDIHEFRKAYRRLAIDVSSEELLLVNLFFNYKSSHPPLLLCPPDVTRIEVFKLDNMVSGKPEWTEVKNLGNRTLFVSSSNVLVSTVDVHGPKESTKGNYIYFAFGFDCEKVACVEPWDGIIIGRQHKSDGRTSYYKFDGPRLYRAPCPIWFVPHFGFGD